MIVQALLLVLAAAPLRAESGSRAEDALVRDILAYRAHPTGTLAGLTGHDPYVSNEPLLKEARAELGAMSLEARARVAERLVAGLGLNDADGTPERVLAMIGRPSMPVLLPLLKGGKKRDALWAISKMPGGEAADGAQALLALLHDAKKNERADIIRALGKACTAATRKDVLAALLRETERASPMDQHSYSLRSRGVEAVGFCAQGGTTLAAVAALTAALSEKDPYVRANAALALGRQGAAAGSAVPSLLAMDRTRLKDANFTEETLNVVLEVIGTPDALKALASRRAAGSRSKSP